MANMARMRCSWAGSGIVGPGLSTFYFDFPVSGVSADVRTYFEAIKSAIPTDVQITVPNEGDLIDDVTGDLTGAWTVASGGGTTTGTNAGTYAAGVGYRVVWNTAGIFRGRRVRGSTFICPLVGAAFNADGTIDSVTLTGHQTAANALVTAQPTLRIWSRPRDATAGESNVVTSATIPNKVSWLRSRRT